MKKSLPILFTGVVALLLSACGSHNNGYGDTDGIYTSESTSTANAETEQTTGKTNYYKQYFDSKSGDYENLPEDDVIFTDIDAYSTTESMDEYGNIIIEEAEYENESYGGWGNNASDVTVNIYNNGGWGYYNYWHRPWGFYNYWGWGNYYCPPFWGIGWAWGNPYWYGGYYGGFYGHYYPYYRNNYYNGYRNVAYNRGRRNSNYYSGRSAYSRSSLARRGSYSQSELNRRTSTSTRRSTNISSDRRNRTSVNGNTNVSRRRANTNVNSNRATRPRPNVQSRPSNSRPKVNSKRPSSSRGSLQRSGGSSRSSGSFRSSGSSRSSSGSRGGGSRRGGRG